MSVGVVSVRYARALLEYSIEERVEDVMYKNMQRLAAVFVQSKELLLLLQSPSLSNDGKTELLCDVVEEPIEQYRRFVANVMKQGREELFRYIAYAYISLYRENKNIVSVKLTTSYGIDEQLSQKIVDMVKSKYDTLSVELDCTVDSSLIGGFVLEADSMRLDASVKGALSKIEKKIVDESRRLI